MADLIKFEQLYAPPQTYEDGYEPPKDQSEVIKQYLHVLRKRKWLIAAVAITVLSAAAVQTYTATAIYTATAQIQIDLETLNILPYQDVSQAPALFFEETYQQTQHRILKSKILARRVVKKLRLGEDRAFETPTSPGLLAGIIPRVTATVISFIVPAGSANQEKTKPKDFHSYEAELADRLVGGVGVNPDKGTRLVDLSYSSPDPRLAARIANALAEEYIELNFETRLGAANMATDFLKKELDQLKIKVEKSDEALLNYAREHGIVNSGESGDPENIVLQKLAGLNNEMTRVQSDLISKSVQNEIVKNATPQTFPESLKTTAILNLEARASDLRQKLANLSARYLPDYPEVVQVKQETFELDDQLLKEKRNALVKVKADYQAALTHYQSISEALEEQKRLANQLNEDSIQYRILKREVDSNKQLYEGLLQRLKEAGVSAGLKSSNIHIVERADMPGGPSAPVHKKNLLLGLLVGLVLGLGLALGIEYFDNTVKTPDELERLVSVPSLGIIPRIGELGMNGRKALPGAINGNNGGGLVYVPPRSAVWEAYRSLRTSILLSHSGKPPRRILVTSAVPGEGKTTTAINTAIVLAQTGARTLLVDLDMRKPEVARKFSLNGNTGMSIFLSGNSDLSSQIVETSHSNLFVIPAGPQPPNPAELVGSDRWQKALGLLSDYFEYIVIDSPPVLSVADPVILSTRVDGVVLVVLAGKTPREAVRKAKSALSGVGATVLGAMINNVDLENGHYSYYYRYYYRYGYYGNETEKKA